VSDDLEARKLLDALARDGDELVHGPSRAEVLLALLRAVAFTPTLTLFALGALERHHKELETLTAGYSLLPWPLLIPPSVFGAIVLVDLAAKARARRPAQVRLAVFEKGRRRLLPLALIAWCAAQLAIVVWMKYAPLVVRKM
jgi:hypothetical protein